MDPITDFWLEHDELRELEPLRWADAGNSTLWTCEHAGELYVFKQYSEEFLADADQEALGGMIAWRRLLPRSDRVHLDRVTVWPRYRVRSHGRLVGVLIPFATREFYHQQHLDEPARPHTIAYLTRVGAKQAAPTMVKCRALGHAAEVLLWLHARQVRVNDLRESNILCARDGSAVCYVDCDVMMGPWGAVGPVAAPQYLADVLPPEARPATGREQPRQEAEIARLAWMAMWVLLDDFSLRRVRPPMLSGIIDEIDAKLLVRSGRLQAVDPNEWRRLAGRWTSRWTATARVSAPVGALTPRLPPTHELAVRPRPSEWVPARYRRLSVAVPVVERMQLEEAIGHTTRRGRTLLLLFLAVVVMAVVVVVLIRRGQ